MGHYISVVKMMLLILFLSSGKVWRRPTPTAASMPSMELLGNHMLGHRALKIWKSEYVFMIVCGKEDRWKILDWIVMCSIDVALSWIFHLFMSSICNCYFFYAHLNIYLSKELVFFMSRFWENYYRNESKH